MTWNDLVSIFPDREDDIDAMREGNLDIETCTVILRGEE